MVQQSDGLLVDQYLVLALRRELSSLLMFRFCPVKVYIYWIGRKDFAMSDKKIKSGLLAALLFVCMTLVLFIVNHYFLNETSTLVQSIASGIVAFFFVFVFTRFVRK